MKKHYSLLVLGMAVLTIAASFTSSPRATAAEADDGDDFYSDSITGDRYFKNGDLWYKILPFPQRGVVVAGFRNDPPVDSIVIPASSSGSLSGVEYSIVGVDSAAFKDVKQLKSVTFEDNPDLTTIGSSAFEGTSLTEVTIPASVEEIGEDAFADTPMKEVRIEAPDDDSHSITIGDGAFDNSPADCMTDVYTEYKDAPAISDKVFPNAHYTTLHYGTDLTQDEQEAYHNDTGWKEFWDSDVTAIADVPIDEVNQLPCHYYMLSGSEVSQDNLTPGMYIVRHGTQSTKVVLR